MIDIYITILSVLVRCDGVDVNKR